MKIIKELIIINFIIYSGQNEAETLSTDCRTFKINKSSKDKII